MLIAQLSDLHVGGARYREELLHAAIEEINGAQPDLVVVAVPEGRGQALGEYPREWPAELAARHADPFGHAPGGPWLANE